MVETEEGDLENLDATLEQLEEYGQQCKNPILSFPSPQPLV